MLTVAQLERDAPGREDTVTSVRKEINDWVAKYRRDTTFSGRPSYGNTYSAVNALAGHVNSFGPLQPVPKKRLERLVKVGGRAGEGGGGGHVDCGGRRRSGGAPRLPPSPPAPPRQPPRS